MARNLVERLKAAMSPRARVTDTETLLTDLKAEQERLTVARERAAAESVDFVLSETDREEAAANAGRLDRTIRGLDAEIAKLAALLEERRSDEARRAKEAEKAAALAERDEIAARFAQRVPAITAELVDLFKLVSANAARMQAVGVHEVNAEFKARGLSGHWLPGGSPVMEFAQMKIPEFHGAGRAWPFDWQTANAIAKCEQEHSDIIRGREKAAREEEAKAEAAAKFAAEHGTYRLTVDAVGNPERIVRIPEELVSGDIPAALGCWDFRELTISHEVAKKLAAVPHLTAALVGEARK